MKLAKILSREIRLGKRPFDRRERVIFQVKSLEFASLNLLEGAIVLAPNLLETQLLTAKICTVFFILLVKMPLRRIIKQAAMLNL